MIKAFFDISRYILNFILSLRQEPNCNLNHIFNYLNSNKNGRKKFT